MCPTALPVSVLHKLLARGIHLPRLMSAPILVATTYPLTKASSSAVEFVTKLKEKCEALSSAGMDAKIASGGGRMGVTMDRYEVGWTER